MNKQFNLVALLIIITLTAGVFIYSPYPYQFWTKLNTYKSDSNVIEKEKPSWKATPVQISKDVFEGGYFFYDEKTIFGVSYGTPSSVYRTLDGGKNWEKRSTTTDFSINDIFFISPTEGFLVLSKPAVSSTPNGSSVMKTEDGGTTWKTVYSSADTNFYNLKFTANGQGVLIGRRELSSSDFTVAILITNDKGQNWTDVSQNLYGRKELKKERDYIVKAVSSADKGVVVLTNTGKLFNTVNQGKSWNLLTLLADKEPQIGFNHLGELENKNFWIAGGTLSIEGKWSEIAVTNRFGWNRYKLNNYYFNDVEFISNNEVIACGSAFKLDTSSNITKELTAAVVMYSPNAGKDWETIYTDEAGWKPIDPRKGGPAFYQIYKISKDKVLVRGEEGIDLTLERISKPDGDE